MGNWFYGVGKGVYFPLEEETLLFAPYSQPLFSSGLAYPFLEDKYEYWS